jgi:hypothetical protein
MYQIGDKIIVTKVPPGVLALPAAQRDGTAGALTVIRRLMRKARPYQVFKVEPDGRVWVRTSFVAKNLVRYFHEVAIDADCVRLYEPRRDTPPT